MAHWNDDTGEYTIPELNMTYKVPFGIDRWSIADPQNLPPKIKFVGVDNQVGIITMIVQPKDLSINVKPIAYDDVNSMISDIIKPNSTEIVYDLHSIIYREGDRWIFRSTYSLTEPSDTVNMSAEGYFFETHGNIVGFIIMAPQSILHTIDSDSIRLYFDGLNIIHPIS